MSEHSSNPDSLNRMMTQGVIAVLITLGVFGLFYSVRDQVNQPTTPAYKPQVNNKQWPFATFDKDEFEKVTKELEEQRQLQEQRRPSFQSKGTISVK